MSQPIDPALNTLLVITGMGVPPFSARGGITQTLTPIPAKNAQKRTVNGTLVDVSAPQFQKYVSEISGLDCDPPALDGIWPGLILTVACVAELSYLTGAAGAPSRPAVAGSTRVEGGFTFYRPTIVFMVTNFSNSTDEWGSAVTWDIELEEV